MFEEEFRRIAHEVAESVVARAELERRDWFDSTEAAKYLCVSRGTVHNWVAEGRLPRRRQKGERLIFSRADLDATYQLTAGVPRLT